MDLADPVRRAALPALDTLVATADEGLHPWVRRRVCADERRTALAEELRFWLCTAAQDLEHARRYADAAPQSGEPAEAYLDRWLPLATGGHVLAGPRYLGRDPDLPFVGVTASDRVLRPDDAGALREVARTEFGAFAPGFVLLSTADDLAGVASWPGGRPEMRQVVGRLGDLRARPVPPSLTTTPRRDTAFYGEYERIHAEHVARDPAHARHTRCEDRDDLRELAEAGLLHDVRVDGTWAGIVAAEADARRGLHGATVVELLLDHPFRGAGHGAHLSTLLARTLPMPNDQYLLGTIHAENVPAYRAALAAGRVDVGGEVVLPLDPG
ncbi:hypothetical protein ENKNEFLB_03862 [Nocardioides aquaticus]|uniref:GNAT family N-acetyltransferase n=1 Tax=Nocardioides aquaticus TaxID=160826 RepID=A0ABX8EQ19_9ACTN|nr:hypothetical protein [Nocardioides aquaticus]QVT81452.1 hypothetical protein ENKNEFLB_03862 [Nocardioides aquaticus]